MLYALDFNNIASHEAQRRCTLFTPQASRRALVLGISMTSRILRSGLAEAAGSTTLHTSLRGQAEGIYSRAALFEPWGSARPL
jgi:hypothetical protein